VSIFSLFELAVKAASGKMEKYNAELVEDNLQTMGLGLLKNASVLTKYKVFNPKNKDPFDNALIATAVEYGVTLVTADSKILSTKVEGLKLMDVRI
jgi:PIN domain nuclease of toxin-antitoxin system